MAAHPSVVADYGARVWCKKRKKGKEGKMEMKTVWP
jgi:hypothetical protein